MLLVWSSARCLGGDAVGSTHDPIATTLFSLIQSTVGFLDPCLLARSLVGADAATDGDAKRIDRPAQIRDGDADALGDLPADVGVGIGQNHEEFFAAVTAEDIAIAAMGARRCRHSRQHVVADAMSKGIVDLLELVEIEQDHG